MSEKTEAPTSRRLRRAVEQGQVPRSRMLTGGAVSAATLWTFLAFAPESAAAFRGFATRMLAAPSLSASAAIVEGTWLLIRVAGLPLGAALCAALFVSAAATGVHVQPSLVQPKLERLDPAAGFKRMFSMKQLGEVFRGVVVSALLGWVAWTVVREVGPAVLAAARSPSPAALTAFLDPVSSLFTRLLAVFCVLAVGDYALARRRHLLDLRMTRQEVKQEHKESEGDPHHRAQRKALHRQLSQRGPARGVQKATAVVINPTHIAVALRYSVEECDAPYLVAKGRDADAFALRAEAKRLGIPVVRDIPLARSLIHYDVGDEIPEELYRAAAGVLHAASQLRDADAHPPKETP